MGTISVHTFHIPVMGLGFTVDTPVKVARFGISSVISIMQVNLLEQMRAHYCNELGIDYQEIPVDDIDYRAKRISAYLDLVQFMIARQLEHLQQEDFEQNSELDKYFRMLPANSSEQVLYHAMLKAEGANKIALQEQLRTLIKPGSIDVNIMSKVDNLNYDKNGDPLPAEYSDALSALRGYAHSKLNSSIVFSAGFNPRLFAYVEHFKDFYADENGHIQKKIILKVSDYRSALVQGKFFAKKGIWVSEFRIESGLNCGGHAFPTEGYLLGPILEEFKEKRNELHAELLGMCNKALEEKGLPLLSASVPVKVTVQGGIGTRNEDVFLREFYGMDATGWGSPFLLVPEATNVDNTTLHQLANAAPDDYFLSEASPLGVPFNNFRHSSGEVQRKARLAKGRPGSPCYKKLLEFNTEFTEKPICTASRQYQHLKLKALLDAKLQFSITEDEYNKQYHEVTSKDCLCDGLSTTPILKNGLPVDHKLDAVTICPGPNLAYFNRISTLEEMVNHIYGRMNLLKSMYRSHTFVNELKLYSDYLKKELKKNIHFPGAKQAKMFANFKNNLLEGVEYYKQLLPKMTHETEEFKAKMREELDAFKRTVSNYCTTWESQVQVELVNV